MFVLLTLLGLIVLFARNPDPILNPAFYAEDGTWTGWLLSDSWWRTFMYARPDYLVWGNLGLLAVALGINRTINGLDLTFLPQWISVVSYVFLSSVAAFAYVVFRRALSGPASFLLFLLLIAAPLGNTGNEVLGRVGNLGLAYLFLCCLLLVWRDRHSAEREPAWRALAVDALIVLCVCTNPVCLPIAVAYLAYLGWSSHRSATGVRWGARDRMLLVVLLALGAWIGWRMAMYRPYADVAVTPVTIDKLVEFVVARQVLYPLVFPFYSKLGTPVTAALGLVWLALVARALRIGSAGRRWGWMIALTLAAFVASTLVMRPLLMNFLQNYQTTIPDRYYYAHGFLVILLTVWALDRLARAPGVIDRPIGILGQLALAGLYVAWLPNLFEYGAPRMPVRTGPSFVEQLRAAPLPSGAQFVTVPGYPVTTPQVWFIKVPARYVRATLKTPLASTVPDVRTPDAPPPALANRSSYLRP